MITPGTCIQINFLTERLKLILVYSVQRRPTNMKDGSERNIVSVITGDGQIKTFSFTDYEFKRLCVIQV
jgi:hypothetical protein